MILGLSAEKREFYDFTVEFFVFMQTILGFSLPVCGKCLCIRTFVALGFLGYYFKVTIFQLLGFVSF